MVMALYALIISIDAGHQDLACRRMILAGACNPDAIRKIVGSAIRAAALCGFIEFSLALCLVATPLAGFAPTDFLANAQGEADASTCLLLLVGYFVTFGSVGGVLVRLYEVHGLLSRSIWIGIFARSLASCAVAVTVSQGGGVIGAVLAQIAAGALAAIFIFVDLRRRFPEYWPWWQSGSLREGLMVVRSSAVLTVVGGMEQLAASILLAMSGGLPDKTATASLTTSRTVGNTVTQGAAVLLHPIAPEIGRYIAQSQPRKVEAALAGASLLSVFPICIGLLILAPALPWAYEQWTRGTLEFDGTLVWVLITAAAVRQWASPMLAYLASAGAVQQQVATSGARSLCIVAVAFALNIGTTSVTSFGIAVLCGECAAALIGIRTTAMLLFRQEAHLPAKVLLTAAAQVMVTACALWLGLKEIMPWSVLVPMSCAATVSLAAVQVMASPPELLSRIKTNKRRSDVDSATGSVRSPSNGKENE